MVSTSREPSASLAPVPDSEPAAQTSQPEPEAAVLEDQTQAEDSDHPKLSSEFERDSVTLCTKDLFGSSVVQAREVSYQGRTALFFVFGVRYTYTVLF
jgi:hypothetical protein